jgi:hypothetical protein
MPARSLACLALTATLVAVVALPSNAGIAFRSASGLQDAQVTCWPSGGAPALSVQPYGLRATYAHRCGGGDIRTLGLEQMVPELAIERKDAEGRWEVAQSRVGRPRSGFRFPGDHAAFRLVHDPTETGRYRPVMYLLLRFSGNVPDRFQLHGRRSARLRGCATADHPHYAICRWVGKSVYLEPGLLPTTP